MKRTVRLHVVLLRREDFVGQGLRRVFFGTSLDKDFDDLELIDEFSGGDELEFQRYQGSVDKYDQCGDK